jgi:hypothetical protein
MIGTRGGRLDWRASTLFVGGKHARPGGNWTVVPAARSYTVPDGGLAIPTLGSLPSPLTRTDDADDALWSWLAGGLVWRQRAVDRQAQGARELLSYLASPDGEPVCTSVPGLQASVALAPGEPGGVIYGRRRATQPGNALPLGPLVEGLAARKAPDHRSITTFMRPKGRNGAGTSTAGARWHGCARSPATPPR